jgi:hypothetical protein
MDSVYLGCVTNKQLEGFGFHGKVKLVVAFFDNEEVNNLY